MIIECCATYRSGLIGLLRWATDGGCLELGISPDEAFLSGDESRSICRLNVHSNHLVTINREYFGLRRLVSESLGALDPILPMVNVVGLTAPGQQQQ